MSKREKKEYRAKMKKYARQYMRTATMYYYAGDFRRQEIYKALASECLRSCIKKTKEYIDIEYSDWM